MVRPDLIAAFVSLAASACLSLAPTFEADLPTITVQCWPGFTYAPSRSACEPIVPAAECPPGSMPLLGARDCQSVGVAACPTGFAADPSGWGCIELAALSCLGATRPKLG